MAPNILHTVSNLKMKSTLVSQSTCYCSTEKIVFYELPGFIKARHETVAHACTGCEDAGESQPIPVGSDPSSFQPQYGSIPTKDG